MVVFGLPFLKALLQQIQEDDCSGLAAEMAYHFLLASAPALVFIFSVIAVVGNPYTLSLQLMQYTQHMLPAQALTLVQGLIDMVLTGGSQSLAIISLLGALWASSNGADAVVKGLSRAYRIHHRPQGEQIGFVRQRITSILSVLLLGLSLFLGSNLLIWGRMITTFLVATFELPLVTAPLVTLARYVLVLGMVTLFSSLIYTLIPGKPYSATSLKKSLVGGGSFVVLWVLISLGFSSYVENFGSYNQVYGSLGAIIVMMLWLYLTSFVFLIGGEINALLYRRNLQPKP